MKYMDNLTLIYLIINVLMLSVAQILLKKGSVGLSNLKLSASGILDLIAGVLKSPQLLLGTFLFCVSYVFYLLALSKTQLNIAQPFTVSLSMILILAGSWIFLGERMSIFQFLGVIMIIIGIVLLFYRS